jgi:hypothetical protein
LVQADTPRTEILTAEVGAVAYAVISGTLFVALGVHLPHAISVAM